MDGSKKHSPMRRLLMYFFRPRAFEPTLYATIGVARFVRMLERIGANMHLPHPSLPHQYLRELADADLKEAERITHIHEGCYLGFSLAFTFLAGIFVGEGSLIAGIPLTIGVTILAYLAMLQRWKRIGITQELARRGISRLPFGHTD